VGRAGQRSRFISTLKRIKRTRDQQLTYFRLDFDSLNPNSLLVRILRRVAVSKYGHVGRRVLIGGRREGEWVRVNALLDRNLRRRTRSRVWIEDDRRRGRPVRVVSVAAIEPASPFYTRRETIHGEESTCTRAERREENESDLKARVAGRSGGSVRTEGHCGGGCEWAEGEREGGREEEERPRGIDGRGI
jgi:hypothetical protein